RLPTPTAVLLTPAVEPPEALPAPLALQPPAAPLIIAAVAATEAPATSLDIPSAPAAEASAEPLRVATTAAQAPAPDGPLSEAGDGAERSPGPDAGAPALGGSLPPALAQPLSTAAVFAPPLPDDGEGADESAAAPLPAPETAWLRAVAAVRTEGDHPDDGRSAFFARLGDQEAFLELLRGDPSEG